MNGLKEEFFSLAAAATATSSKSSPVHKMLDFTHDAISKASRNRRYFLKTIFIYFFFPVAVPVIIYRVVKAFRERFGFKKRCLEGKVVLITGASSGIGESLAQILYSSGCRLILASRRVNELERVKADLVRSTTYGTVYIPAVIELDLQDLNSLPDKARTALQIYGEIDILVNNAGVSSRGTVLETALEVDQKIMSTNYMGPLALTKVIAKSMVAKKTGRIVFISSIQGKAALPNRSSYTASKHAVQALADSLRAELSMHGVEVTVISPGYVRTNLSSKALTGSGDEYKRTDQTTAQGSSPNYVARQTVNAIMRGDKDVIISPLFPRLLILLRYLLPSVFFRLMARRARNENVTSS